MPQGNDITVNIEGGPTLHFPLGTNPNVIQTTVKKYAPSAIRSPMPGESLVGRVSPVLRMAEQGGPQPDQVRQAELYGIKALPAAGMTAGGMLGGIPGAALGGGAGEAAEQLAARYTGLEPYPKTPLEAAEKIGGQAAAGAVTELGGRLAGKLISKPAEALAPVKLPSGDVVRVTPGVKAGTGGFLEGIAGQMIAGKPLRTQHAMERDALVDILKKAAGKQAARWGAGTAGITDAEQLWQSFDNAGASIRQAAEPVYNSIKETMRDPSSATPAMEAMIEFARDEYVKGQALRRILSTVTSEPRVTGPEADIGPLELRDDIERLAKLKDIMSLRHADPSELFQAFLDKFGGDTSVFDVFRRTRSNLYALLSNPRIKPNDARIISGLASELTMSMEDALKRTGGEELVQQVRDADAMWSQSRALEELSKGLRKPKVSEGLPESSQAEGVRKLKPSFKAAGLEEHTRQSMIPKYHGGKSLLERAIPDKIDRTTYENAADLLSRSIREGGGHKFAAKWHGLAVLGWIGATGTLGLTGHPFAAAGSAAGPEVAAYIISKALTSKTGANLLSAYLRHPQGSQEAMKAGVRLAQWALGSVGQQPLPRMRTGQESPSVSGLPTAPPPPSNLYNSYSR